MKTGEGLSVFAKVEGLSFKNIAGRGASERQVGLESLADDAPDEALVTAEGCTELGGGTDDGARASSSGGVVVGRVGVEQRMFGTQSAIQRDESREGEVDDNDFRGDEESVQFAWGHRLRVPATGLGLAAWAKTSRKSFSSSRASSLSAATASNSSARFMRTR